MSTTRTARLADVTLPDFGRPAATPELPASLYAARLERLRERMADRGYDRLVVYADREHSANLAYLTGFDPRFEEAVLVVGDAGEPAILVGNECYGMAGAAPLPMRRHRFQDLSLPSQPRDRSRPLAEILGDEGVTAGTRVGVVGWKPYADRSMLDVPAFLADALRRVTGPSGLVENAADLLIDPADGLRVINEVEQLAAMEAAACTTSSGVRGVLTGLRPGHARARRRRPARLGRLAAVVPPDAHRRPAGRLRAAQPGRPRRSSAATRSPSRSGSGARSTAGPGSWSRTRPSCRTASATTSSGSSGPYFAAVAEWYGALRIGQTGGALQAIIDRHLGDPFFGIFLNPGHQIDLDEWVNSPISARARRSSSGRAWRSRSTSSRRPARRTSRPTSRTASPSPTRRSGTAFATGLPGRLGAHRGPPRVHGRRARHRAPPGRPAVLEHPGLPAAVPAAAGPGHDDDDVSERLVLRAGDAELTIDAGRPAPASRRS